MWKKQQQQQRDTRILYRPLSALEISGWLSVVDKALSVDHWHSHYLFTYNSTILTIGKQLIFIPNRMLKKFSKKPNKNRKNVLLSDSTQEWFSVFVYFCTISVRMYMLTLWHHAVHTPSAGRAWLPLGQSAKRATQVLRTQPFVTTAESVTGLKFCKAARPECNRKVLPDMDMRARRGRLEAL